MNKDDLHLTQLTAQAQLLHQPRVAGSGTQIVLTGQALSARDASAIYGEVARFGYTGFTMIPGGAQIASADGATVVQLTGAGWSFAQDLTRIGGIEPAVDRLGVTIEQFMSKFPGASFAGHTVDLQARWDHVDQGRSDRYIAQRFLTQDGTRMGDFEGFTPEGGGLRLHFVRASTIPLLPGVQVWSPAGQQIEPLEEFDARIETFYADKSKLFLEVTGLFAVPAVDISLVTSRARLVHELLWNQLADKITMEVS
jgi:hypothetical protein